MTESKPHQNDSNIEWSAIRRNWPIILTFVAGLGFAIEQWDRLQDQQARLDKIENIVSIEGIVAHEKWKTRTNMRLDALENE